MRRHLLPLASLILITLAVFWHVGHLRFIGYDDLDYVYQNPAVQSGLNADSIAWAFDGFHAGNWHPITWLSHMLDCQLFGTNPHEEHWVNLLLHTLNTCLLFVWLQQLTTARWRSFFVAALFAIHPLHVQSVAWISERKDVLSTFFFLATLIAYTRFSRKATTANQLAVILFFALGLMAKPMLVTLPLILLLLDFWPLRRLPANNGSHLKFISWLKSWQPLIAEKIPLFTLSLASCIVTYYAQQSAGATHASEILPLEERLAHAMVSCVQYLRKTIWPVDLAIFYPLPSSGTNAAAVCGALLILAGITGLALWRRKSQPYLLFGWLWFLVMLIPVIGIIQVGLQSIADRYMYLPSIGFFILIVWSAAEIAAKSETWRLTATAAGCLAIAACAWDTRYQLGFWRDNISLFQHVVEVSPENNYMGYFYLGLSHAEKKDLDSAAKDFQLALQANPAFAVAQQRLGNVYLIGKKFSKAEPVLQALVNESPDDSTARATHGLALAGLGKYLDAQSEFDMARQLAPNNGEINRMWLKNAPNAGAELTISNLTAQLQTNATPEAHVQLAQAQAYLEQYHEAIDQYQKALLLAPDSPDCLNNLAWLLATCPDASIRNGPKAVEYARRACELTGYKQTILIGTLAAAYAEAGDFNSAATSAQRACDTASANGETDLAKRNHELLVLYQNHQAFHEATPTDAGGN